MNDSMIGLDRNDMSLLSLDCFDTLNVKETASHKAQIFRVLKVEKVDESIKSSLKRKRSKAKHPNKRKTIISTDKYIVSNSK